MSSSIPSLLSTASFAPAPGASNAAAALNTQPVQQNTNVSADTVTLTEAQQVFNLYNAGQTVPEIATSLSLPVTMVNNYLGITQGG